MCAGAKATARGEAAQQTASASYGAVIVPGDTALCYMGFDRLLVMQVCPPNATLSEKIAFRKMQKQMEAMEAMVR